MSQVTIYLDSAVEAAARQAAARAKLSLSRWFAQFAEAEKSKLSRDRDGFWAEIDRLRAQAPHPQRPLPRRAKA